LNLGFGQQEIVKIFQELLGQTSNAGDTTLEIADLIAIVKVYWSFEIEKNPNLKLEKE
jgi:hypothetical protein